MDWAETSFAVLERWRYCTSWICPTRYFVLIILILSLSACAGPGKVMVWKTEQIVNSPHAKHALLDPNSKTYATVNTSQIKQINDAKLALSSVASVYPQLVIVEGKDPNAFALVFQGQRAIGINIGMLKLLENDYDAFAFLIGHEMAHHVCEHGKTREDRKTLIQAVGILAGFGLGFIGVPGGGLITDLGVQVVHTAYTRAEEREADALGLKYMIDAKFDPQGAIRLQEKLSKASSNLNIPFLSTHPATSERIENLNAIIGNSKKSELQTASFPVKPQPPSPTAPDQETGRDGTYIAYTNGIVRDTKTGLEWVAGPDRDITWDQAKAWVKGLNVGGGEWRMPTVMELEALYQKGKGTRNITPLLKTTGWWVWSGELRDSASAWGLGFYLGNRRWDAHLLSFNGRAFAVRSRSDK